MEECPSICDFVYAQANYSTTQLFLNVNNYMRKEECHRKGALVPKIMNLEHLF